jgi:hypothetical protein
MPSPFPGMDPFIQGQRWQDFHTTFLAVLKESLVPAVRPRYSVDIEQDVYLVSEEELTEGTIEPDLALVETSAEARSESSGSASSVMAVAPAVYTVSTPKRRKQKYLTIRDREQRKIVTVIELLSPTNKSPGDGFLEYQCKRENIFNSCTNLVELDLLRGGKRFPTRERLPAADFCAFICRATQLPKVDVYAWTLRHRLPTVPVPLAVGEAEVSLDLQDAFTKTYDRSGYDYALDYCRPAEPPLEGAVAEWATTLLAKSSV